MRKLFVTALVVSAAAATVLPAAAADTGTTQVTVSLVGGGLSIEAPATAALTGGAAAGTVITGPLGATPTKVTDSTGSLLGWDVVVATTGDLVSATDAAAVIPLTAAGPLLINAGAVTAGTLSLLSGVQVGTAGFLSPTALPLVVAAAGAGGGAYTYTPALTLTVPPNTLARDDYKVDVVQTLS